MAPMVERSWKGWESGSKRGRLHVLLVGASRRMEEQVGLVYISSRGKHNLRGKWCNCDS